MNKSNSIHAKPPVSEHLAEHIRQMEYLANMSNRQLLEKYANRGEAKKLFMISVNFIWDYGLSVLLSIFTILTFPITCWLLLLRPAFKDRRIARERVKKHKGMTRSRPEKDNESGHRLQTILKTGK